jgi:23S rRNA (cytosine1962-C5)-methyltransferase
MQEFPRLILKPGRDKAARNRHPWIFSGAVLRKPQAGHGDVVAVAMDSGEILGFGHYAPEATLICRLFDFGSQTLDLGDAYWYAKLQDALAYRRRVLDLRATDGFRLVHAEGDNLPGVVIDLYADAASVQLRTAGARVLAPVIQRFLVTELGIKHIFVSIDKKDGKEELHGQWVFGEPGERIFEENGQRFYVDIEMGQKTGFFLDQRDNRQVVRRYAEGRTVLNAFAYSGAFSAFALQGGAAHVSSVDISAQATEYARRNVNLNFSGPDTPHAPIKADVFQYLKEMPGGKYDLIILDPPAFTKHISTVDKAARGYKEINLKAMQKIAPGGLLFTFSCSQHISTDLFRKIVFGAAADAGRNVRLVEQLTQAADHPVSIFHPEGEYLKGLVLHIS